MSLASSIGKLEDCGSGFTAKVRVMFVVVIFMLTDADSISLFFFAFENMLIVILGQVYALSIVLINVE